MARFLLFLFFGLILVKLAFLLMMATFYGGLGWMALHFLR
jgi:hypothetical protein